MLFSNHHNISRFCIVLADCVHKSYMCVCVCLCVCVCVCVCMCTVQAGSKQQFSGSSELSHRENVFMFEHPGCSCKVWPHTHAHTRLRKPLLGKLHRLTLISWRLILAITITITCLTLTLTLTSLTHTPSPLWDLQCVRCGSVSTITL